MDFLNSADFASHVKALIKKHHVPGLAIAIAHNETTASRAFGMASFEPSRPMTTDTLFDIASASKSLTAASVALLVADNDKHPDVKYEAAMAELLPGEFVMSGRGHEGVTVEDILSHRSGLARNDSSYHGVLSKHPDDARSITRNLPNLSTAAPIRSKFMYCNIMFTVASYLVEQKSGLSFADYLDQHFFQPLKMTSSNLQPERARAKGLGDRITPGHWWDRKTKTYLTFKTPEAPEAQGAGSIVTSVDDYVKYVRAIMNKQAPFTEDVYKGIIRARTIATPDYERLSPFSSPLLYAAGWAVHYYRGRQVFYHTGSIYGIATIHFFLPEFHFGGTIFSNSDDGIPVVEALRMELIDEILQVPHEERLDWPKIIYEKQTGKKYENYDDDIYSGDDEAKQLEENRQKLCPGIKESEPQKMPLSAYTGLYWNPGWRGFRVQVKDEHLFIDCSDRSFVFSLTLDHVCEQTKYITHVRDVETGRYMFPGRAEFRFENNVAVRLGVVVEPDLDHYTWFERVNSDISESTCVLT